MNRARIFCGDSAEGDRVVNLLSGMAHSSEAVARSWKRCIQDFKLDPDARRTPPQLTLHELDDRRSRMADLVDCAQLEMTTLYQQLADPDLAVVLTDADGVILHMVSSSAFAQDVKALGFCVGSVWSECEAGTNGMGTCLVEKAPVAVRQHEHFLSQYASLTCSAVPLSDHLGRTIGVLDVTSRSPLLQQHSLVLVGMSGQMIENRLLDARFGDAFSIHFHSRPELVYTLHEGKLFIGGDGRICSANRSALFQLGSTCLEQLIGTPLSDIFKTTLEESAARSARNAFHPVPVYRANASNRFFMVAQAPQLSSTSGSTRTAPEAAPNGKRPGAHGQNGTTLRAESFAGLSFGDPQMDEQIRLAQRVVTRRIPILLRGETGSGKEVFANAIHQMSGLASGPFVAVNCASLPESLIESELFGYKAGAFTGAQREGRRGKIIQANGGTLFLDEIGDMPLLLQARLLRVLEEREVTPLGSEAVIKVDFNLVSASHRDLAELVRTGQFREDLYYRLGGIELQIPPLRERADRLELIERILVEEAGPEPFPQLSSAALDVLLGYSWPGNLRQLRTVLRIATALSDGAMIECEHLPADVVSGGAAASSGTLPEPFDDDADALASQHFNAIQLNERHTILELLRRHRWNVSTVARSLAISRNTLYRKMHRLHIRVTQSPQTEGE